MANANPLATSAMRQLATDARAASRVLGHTSTAKKNAALKSMSEALREHARAIVSANSEDMESSRAEGKNAAFLDRLMLDEKRVHAMADAVDEVVALPDPIGEVTDQWKRPNGLQIEKVRLPLGTLLMIYESRPNVTSDAAALCLKSGNAVILRGGKESMRSNKAIVDALHQGIAYAEVPKHAVQLVPTPDHAAMLELLQLDGLIDLCIPRGGEALIRFVAENARVPVIKHYKGVCHVYVHSAADLEKATNIIVNAKTHRPGVCNAAECLLVDRSVADRFLPMAGPALASKKVELRADPTSFAILQRSHVPVKSAAPDDFGREFLDLILAVRVVKDLDQALEHIATFGSEHTEAIITADDEAARRFASEVNASAVMINASTRFNDGGELGLGAEIGISTSRLHAFGPMGLRELTSQKYVVHGRGQVR